MSQEQTKEKPKERSRAKSRDKSNEKSAVKSRAKGKQKANNRGRDKTMLKFKYDALDDTGKKVSGVEMALSAGAAHLALRERHLQPLEVIEKTSILKFEITKKRAPRKEVMNFSRQLAVFMAAGIPIMEALEVIVEETSGNLMRNVILEMIDSLRNGDTFAAAAAAHPEAFPNYYVGILESAELTGNLDIVLTQLADYMDRDGKARAKITSALIYPSVVALSLIHI